MESLLKFLTHHWGLSSTDYWHLRLLCSLLLGPLVGVLCLVFFNGRVRPAPRPGSSSKPTMWVGRDGRLFSSQ